MNSGISSSDFAHSYTCDILARYLPRVQSLTSRLRSQDFNSEALMLIAMASVHLVMSTLRITCSYRSLVDFLLKGYLARYFSASSPKMTLQESVFATCLSSPSSPILAHAVLSFIFAEPITRLRSTASALRQQNNVAPFLRLNHPLPLPLTIVVSSLVVGLPRIIMTRRDTETKCLFGCQRLRKHVIDFAQLVAINFSCGTPINCVSRQLSGASQFQDFTSGKAQMFCDGLSVNVGF